jgi:uncharacterized protein involved in exopolysaccharide biosynthesis/Mrp family chromosome partitioning ATPase
MNTEGTMLDDESAEARPSGFSLKDVYYVFFRHKTMILVGLFLGIVSSVGVYFYKPPKYQSIAVLFVRYVVEQGSKSLDPAANDSQIKSPDSGGGGIIGTERVILASFDSAKVVAAIIGPEKILAKVGGGTNRLQAAGVITGDLATEAMGNDMIKVTFEHPDPALVQPVLRQLITNYFYRHYEFHQPGGFDEVLEKRAEELGVSLKQTEDKLTKLKRDAGVTSLEETKKAYADQISKIRTDLSTAQAELAGEKAALVEPIDSPRENTTKTTVIESKVPTDKVDEYRSLSARLDSLHKQADEYRIHYAEESVFVKSVRERMADLQKQRRKLEENYPTLAKTSVPAPGGSGSPSPGGQAVDPSLEPGRRVAGLEAKVSELKKQLDDLHTEATKVDEAEPEIVRLQRDRDLLDKNYNYCKTSLEQSKANQALGAGKLSNIGLVQEPSPPAKDYKKTLKRVGIAFAFWFFGGVGIAFLIELVLDHSVRRSEEIPTKLHLPLFLTIPLLNRQRQEVRPGRNEGGGIAAEGGRTGSEGASAADTQDIEGHGPMTIAPSSEAHNGLRAYYDALRNRLITYFEMNNMTHRPKMIAITSCSKGAGVTSTASGLAATLSETGDGNVLLVDMNSGQGAAHPFYRGKPACGLSDLLEAGKRPSASAGAGNLYLASVSGVKETLPRTLPERFTDLVPKLKMSDYDYIIFDMPPVSATSATPRMTGYMDIVLLVLEAERTGQQTAARASTLMREARANVAAVLNKCRPHVPAMLGQEL